MRLQSLFTSVDINLSCKLTPFIHPFLPITLSARNLSMLTIRTEFPSCFLYIVQQICFKKKNSKVITFLIGSLIVEGEINTLLNVSLISDVDFPSPQQEARMLSSSKMYTYCYNHPRKNSCHL